MSAASKRATLQKLLDKAIEIKVRSSDDPVFKAWKNTVERALVRIYGQPSPEVEHFNELLFFYNPIMWVSGDDFTHEHRQRFDRDLQILLSSIKSCIEEIPDDPAEERVSAPLPTGDADDARSSRLFVSHAAADRVIVEDLVELLEIIGLTHEQIFCTSLPNYDIDLGENFLDAIKAELLNRDTLVLFVLTSRFYESPISMCEMGATWVLAKEHIPIIVPPLKFEDVRGVIPQTQGFKINDALKLNLLKQKIESVFKLTNPLPPSAWERKRDRVLERINRTISGAGTPAKT